MSPNKLEKAKAGDAHRETERAALRHLKRVDPVLHAAALPHRGSIAARVSPKKTNLALFQSLVSSVVSQQLSTKAAASIHARLKENIGGITPTTVAQAPVPIMRGSGLSEAKVKTLKALSTEIMEGRLNLLSLKKVSAEEAVTTLSSIWGIGPWTAEMFLIFALGSPDVYSPGDLILAKKLEELRGVPRGSISKKELAVLAQAWSPHRSFASLLLWKLNDADK